MRLLFFSFLFAAAVYAQPQATPREYSEPRVPGKVKVFRYTHVTPQGADSLEFQWLSSGVADSLDNGTYLYAYREKRGRISIDYLFAATDTMLAYFPSHDLLEDSDAVRELYVPLAAGAAWQHKLSDTARAEIVSIGGQVTVPAGTYNGCIAVACRGAVTYYAPGAGIVKIVQKGADFINSTVLLSER